MLPNVFFHTTTTFDILRHNGVEIGKQDFLGTAPKQWRAPSGRGGEPLQLPEPHRGRGAVLHPQLHVRVLEVLLHRAHARAKDVGHLPVALAGRDPAQHLALARRISCAPGTGAAPEAPALIIAIR